MYNTHTHRERERQTDRQTDTHTHIHTLQQRQNKKINKMSKKSEFFLWHTYTMFVVHVKFHREITLVEGVVKETKSML